MSSETSTSVINDVPQLTCGNSDDEGILDKLTKVFNENKTYVIIAGVILLLGILTLYYLSKTKEPEVKPKVPSLQLKTKQQPKQVKKLVHQDEEVNESESEPLPRKPRKKVVVSSESEEETNNDMKEYDLTKSELEDINNELGKIKSE